MSVNGKPNEGDVYLDKDGYMRIHFKSIHGVWYTALITPESKKDLMWFDDPKREPYVPPDSKFVMNIKSLLVSVRKDVLDESSN